MRRSIASCCEPARRPLSARPYSCRRWSTGSRFLSTAQQKACAPTRRSAGGSRRTTTFMLDGASNDEGWGRQTMIATVPVGAIQEVSVLSNAFSAEFGWTAGPAMNIVTKSGTNDLRGEGLFMTRPGAWQAKTFGTDGFCAPSVASCITPATLTAINPADVPDELNQFSGTIGAPLVKDKTFFFTTADYTRQDRTTFLSNTLPSFCCRR